MSERNFVTGFRSSLSAYTIPSNLFLTGAGDDPLDIQLDLYHDGADLDLVHRIFHVLYSAAGRFKSECVGTLYDALGHELRGRMNIDDADRVLINITHVEPSADHQLVAVKDPEVSQRQASDCD